jgi:hypothetical protein
MIASVQSALTSLGLMGSAAATTAAEVTTAGTVSEAAGAEFATAGAEADAAAGQLTLFGESAVTAGAEAGAAGAEAGAAGLAGGMGAAESASGGLSGALGPLGLAVGIVGISAFVLNKEFSQTTTALGNAAVAAGDMTANTLPQMTVKLDALRGAQEKLTTAFKNHTDTSLADALAYGKLGGQVDTLRTQQTNLNNNLTILSANFGLSKSQAEGLANAAGIDLKKSLDPAQVVAFKQQIQESGATMDTTGTKAQNMGTTTVAAVSSMAAQMKTTLTTNDWTTLGQSVDTGVASGITSSMGVVINAAQGMVQTVISASRTGLRAASPSRVAADLIGAPFAQGVALGITEKTAVVADAAQKMMNASMTAISGASATVPTPVITPTVAGSSPNPLAGGGGPVTMNLVINGQTFARGVFPDLLTVMLQNKRSMLTLGLS